MSSSAELMYSPPITDYQREAIKALAIERIDIDGEIRLSEPASTQADAYNYHEVLTGIFSEYGKSDSSRLSMSCKDLGGTVLRAEFTPNGMHNYNVDEWTISRGIWHCRAKITSDVIVPAHQQVFLARLVQTKTPVNPLLRHLRTVGAAVATRREVNDATAKAKLFLENGSVDKLI